MRSGKCGSRQLGILILLAGIWTVPDPGWAQQPVLDRLQPGLDQIREDQVKEVVSFLASDEMAGRDTPSPELTRAEEFVAQQFRKAGLEGGARDGSFFEASEIATVRFPFEEIEFTVGGQPAEHFGLQTASDGEVAAAGVPVAFDPNDDKQQIEGVAWVDAREMNDRRSIFRITDLLSQAQQRGAAAVLLQVSEESPLLAAAARARRPQMVNPRRRVSIPALLVTELDPGQEIALKIPAAEFGKATVRNVVGMLPGSDTDLAREAILFSAHLDHIGTQPGLPDPVYNGADDNATGVTAVLMLARAYGALEPRPKRTTLFVTFWGEEKGLLGSRKYVSDPAWPLERTVANVNIEMVGRPEPGAREKSWMTGWEKSNLGTLMATGAEQVGVEIFNHPQFSGMLYRASDNYPFAEKGVVAHSFSAGSLHGDYHQVGDHWQKLELDHMTRVIQGLFAGSFPIANGESTPAATDASE